METKNAVVVKSVSCISPDNDPLREYQLRGEISEVTFTDENFLTVMYNAIDTNIIEGVDLPSLGIRIWLDEEGKLKDTTEINIDASILYQTEYNISDDFIFGHVVFTSASVTEDGYTEGLTDMQREKLLDLLKALQSTRPEQGIFTKVLTKEPKEGFIDG